MRTVLDVIAAYSAAHPAAPRVVIGDLSRPGGGNFGEQFGGIGHASHQNGLDADIYYPRKDRRETAPRTVAQVDQPRSQELVDRFVAAGARYVFVGPHLRLRGPKAIVMPLVNHDNHLHVRIPNPIPPRRAQIGRSADGRPIRAWQLGDPYGPRRVLVIGCVHGDECAGTAVTKQLLRRDRLLAARPVGRPEPEPRRGRPAHAAERARRRPQPQLPLGVAGERRARVAGVPRARGALGARDSGRERRSCGGSAPTSRSGSTSRRGSSGRGVAAAGSRSATRSSQAYRSAPSPGLPEAGRTGSTERSAVARSFVVELPGGPLSAAAADRHAAAVIALATGAQ